jgi:CoA-transferase family III
MAGPLRGVRVLDLTGVVSGPFATMLLADQGADVIKIEPIGGDITRRSRATIDSNGQFSALFISSNRGKRSHRDGCGQSTDPGTDDGNFWLSGHLVRSRGGYVEAI